MWTTCLVLSIAIFCVFLLFFPVSAGIKFLTKSEKRFALRPSHLLTAGTFCASAILMFPSNHVLYGGGAKAALISLQNAARFFVLDFDYSDIVGQLPADFSADKLFYLWSAIMLVLAPVLTVVFALLFFKKAWASMRLFFRRGRSMYIFSELNEKSLALADSIRHHKTDDENDRKIAKKYRKSTLLFTDVLRHEDERSVELLAKAEALGAICHPADIASLKLWFVSKKVDITFFFIGEDANENLTQATTIISQYKDRVYHKNQHITETVTLENGQTEQRTKKVKIPVPNTRAYVFDYSTESDLLLSNIDKGYMHVFRVNEMQSLIYRTLYEEGGKLFEGAVQIGEKKRITAVIVGAGLQGTEMFKALVWFCQMDGYELCIHVFDKNKDFAKRYTLDFPELLDERLNGKHREGDAYYDIHLHPGIDIQGSEFSDEIYKIPEITFAFVALGTDKVNVETAYELRIMFERKQAKDKEQTISPTIQTVVYNSDICIALKDAKNYKSRPYGISFIGDLKSSFSVDVIIDSELEERALEVQMRYGSEEDFWKYEYCYMSSMASAVHARARLFCQIPGADLPEADRTPAQTEINSVIEHCRWDAYMRTEGYISGISKDGKDAATLGKMHPSLRIFEDLSDDDKRKDARVSSGKGPKKE